jgi:signal transduction histidine kinase
VGEACLDEKIIRHILGNLLSNAVKYSFAGQPVKLEVRRIAGNVVENGNPEELMEGQLELKVSDSGIGIPTADLAKLYQTFHRAANVGNRPGSGMGLAIVKQFVDLLGGRIRLESQEGKGTTIWVVLPIASPSSPTE